MKKSQFNMWVIAASGRRGFIGRDGVGQRADAFDGDFDRFLGDKIAHVGLFDSGNFVAIFVSPHLALETKIHAEDS